MHTYVHTYHYITLHYITLHYSTLHYITLQYITLHTYIITYIQIHKYIYIYIYTHTHHYIPIRSIDPPLATPGFAASAARAWHCCRPRRARARCARAVPWGRWSGAAPTPIGPALVRFVGAWAWRKWWEGQGKIGENHRAFFDLEFRWGYEIDVCFVLSFLVFFNDDLMEGFVYFRRETHICVGGGASNHKK